MNNNYHCRIVPTLIENNVVKQVKLSIDNEALIIKLTQAKTPKNQKIYYTQGKRSLRDYEGYKLIEFEEPLNLKQYQNTNIQGSIKIQITENKIQAIFKPSLKRTLQNLSLSSSQTMSNFINNPLDSIMKIPNFFNKAQKITSKLNTEKLIIETLKLVKAKPENLGQLLLEPAAAGLSFEAKKLIREIKNLEVVVLASYELR